jgi:peptide/nickel transport system substrate-binding protein
MKRVIVAALMTAFAAGASDVPSNPGGRELRFSIPGDPRSFDPLHAALESSGELIRYLTGGVLMRVDRATDGAMPELAESWRMLDGGRAIAFRLREGLRFSDGSPLTTADVARTLTSALDPKEASPTGDTFQSAGGAPKIEVRSPRDIVIRYAAVKPGLDRLFDQLAIAPKDRAARLPATSGSYFVAEYKPGSAIILRRNPWYWKHDGSGARLPYFDSIRIDIQGNRDIELARFERGEIDLIAGLDPETFDRLAKAKPGMAHDVGASLDSEFLWFNQAPSASVPEWKRKWFASAAFRRAISASIHREDLIRIAYKGHAHAAAGPVSTANRFWFNARLKPLAYNASAAQALLAAGFTLRNGVLRDASGHAVEFSLITNAGNREREKMAALIQSDLSRIGVRVNIVTLDFGSLIERIAKTGAYEACLLGFANVDEDPIEEMNVWLSSGAHHAWWPLEKSPATAWEARIDQLEMAQASESSRALRKKALDEMQEIVSAQQPIVYLVNPDYLYAISPAVKGVKPGITPPQLLWNVEWLRK